MFGVRPAWVRSHLHIGTSMLLYLRSFTRKLPFPGPLDRARAERGRGLFDDTCARCHGYYVQHGDEMRVSHKERVVPLDEVGTDPARADAVTPDFVEVSNSVALTEGLTRVRHTGGYVPPVLLDVWATGRLRPRRTVAELGGSGHGASGAASALRSRFRRALRPGAHRRAVRRGAGGAYARERIFVRRHVARVWCKWPCVSVEPSGRRPPKTSSNT